ncbi:MAG TPA: Fe-S cluster assembly protein IscX [Candidatus Methylomirabilis sp.]|nr:Fe-S cluster assembly protein IscX [Candidatus Methylomirabilis sp.]
MGFTWDDVDEIADALAISHPDVDPMELSIPRLRALITDLSGFLDDPDRSDDSRLEAIQEAWYDRIG